MLTVKSWRMNTSLQTSVEVNASLMQVLTFKDMNTWILRSFYFLVFKHSSLLAAFEDKFFIGIFLSFDRVLEAKYILTTPDR